MIKYFFPILLLIACTEKEVEPNHSTQKKQTTQSKNESSRSKYSYKVIFEEENGWGYQIFNGPKMLINQMHIPAIQGLQSFSSEKKAKTTAIYILNQVEQGHFPPTITKEILDSLDVLN